MEWQGVYIAWFPLKYNSASSKSLNARSYRASRKFETPHWKYLGTKNQMGGHDPFSLYLRNSQVIVQSSRFDKLLHCSFMFAQRRIDQAHIRQDLGRIGNSLSI